MSTQFSAQRKLDFKAVQSIIAKRKILRLVDDGAFIKVHIQSNGGTTIPVTDKDGTPVMSGNGMPLFKTIYNVSANSQVAMVNPNNRKLLADAMKHESAGDMDKATELYNQYLNKIQVSFNVLLTGANAPTFSKNDLVKGTVQVITTENGQLITLDKVSAVEAVALRDTPKFTLNELLGISDDVNPEDLFTTKDVVKTDATA